VAWWYLDKLVVGHQRLESPRLQDSTLLAPGSRWGHLHMDWLCLHTDLLYGDLPSWAVFDNWNHSWNKRQTTVGMLHLEVL
jgi:hypothetical protein